MIPVRVLSCCESTAPGKRQDPQRNRSDGANQKECPANGFALFFGELVRKEKGNPAPQGGAGPGNETQFRNDQPYFLHKSSLTMEYFLLKRWETSGSRKYCIRSFLNTPGMILQYHHQTFTK
jgi:hypothetical protein